MWTTICPCMPKGREVLKILHVTNAYPYNENPIAGIFVKEQIDSLNKYLDKNDIYVINAKKNGRLDYLKALFILRKKVKEYNIVHAHHIYVGFLLLLFNKKKNNILVSLMSDPERKTGSLLTNFIYRTAYKYCAKYAKGLIFKKEIPDTIQRGDVYYLPNGVNMELFVPCSKSVAKQKLGLDENKRYVLFVSAMNLHRKEKRYDRFQKVMNVLRTKYGIQDLVELTMVNVDRELSPLYYNACELSLLVSDVEGSPNSVKESISCNTPVVSTDVGNVRTMIGELDACKVVSSFDVEEIAKAVYDVLNKEKFDLRRQLDFLGLSQDNVAQKLNEIYRCL